MRATQWLAAHWPGGTPGPAKPERQPPADAGPAPEANRSSAGVSVVRWITAPFRWAYASSRSTFAWAAQHWPGYDELPPVYGPPVPAALELEAEPAVYGPPVPMALRSEAVVGSVESEPVAEAGEGQGHRLAERRRRRVPPLGLRQIGAVFHAVYAALADPIARADQATKDKRAAQARKAGLAAASVALAVLLVYSIFPVRAFLHQWNATDRQQDRLDILTEQNQLLEERVERLKTEEEIERLAREQHGLVHPGEKPVILLPAPEE